MTGLEENKSNETGSPPSGGPAYLTVGKFRRPHGLDGEIILEVLTDFPERLRKGKKVFVGNQYRPIVLKAIRPHGRFLLLRLEGFDTPEQVGELRNLAVHVPASELPKLSEGEYYYHQIIGLRVVDENGQILGVLEEILETGANDVYNVKTDSGKELLLPAVDEVVLKIDLERGEIVVRPQDWL